MLIVAICVSGQPVTFVSGHGWPLDVVDDTPWMAGVQNLNCLFPMYGNNFRVMMSTACNLNESNLPTNSDNPQSSSIQTGIWCPLMIQRPSRFIPGLTSMDLQERATCFMGKSHALTWKTHGCHGSSHPTYVGHQRHRQDSEGCRSEENRAILRVGEETALIKQRCFEDVWISNTVGIFWNKSSSL